MALDTTKECLSELSFFLLSDSWCLEDSILEKCSLEDSRIILGSSVGGKIAPEFKCCCFRTRLFFKPSSLGGAGFMNG